MKASTDTSEPSLYKQMEADSDLQEILIQKIQNNMNTILDDAHLSKDLFELPRDALKLIMSS